MASGVRADRYADCSSFRCSTFEWQCSSSGKAGSEASQESHEGQGDEDRWQWQSAEEEDWLSAESNDSRGSITLSNADSDFLKSLSARVILIDFGHVAKIFKRPKNREDSSDFDDFWTELIVMT